MTILLRHIEALSARLAGLIVVAIMLIVSTDAIARYLFRAPLPWAFDLISYYLLIAALYFALSATFQSGDHISIELFRGMLPKRALALMDVAWGLMAAAVFGVIAFGAWEEMVGAYRNRQFLPGYFPWPAWASYPPIVIGGGLLVLRLLHHCFQLLAHGEDAEVATSGEHVE